MRWHPVLPLSIARRTDADDYDPRDFIPERFLDPEEVADPATWAFGFGRRICPGRYLAENSVFIIVSSLLATFSISSPEKVQLSVLSLVKTSYPERFKLISRHATGLWND
ncbi:hypothetical protein ACEPAG_9804 [Sanghuangporus baumii]